jgi:hypothetical protein
MSFPCREIESHFQPITGYGAVLGTAMSCQPGVEGDPEKRSDSGLRLRHLSSERRIHERCPTPWLPRVGHPLTGRRAGAANDRANRHAKFPHLAKP